MQKKGTARAAAIAALLAAVVSAAGASSAEASTPGCTQGVYQGYCGTQTDHEASALSFDVYQQRAVAGNKIIGYPDSAADRATDFFIFAFGGGLAKIFEYAPGGVASNLCISEPAAQSGLVLRACNGSAWQQFTATEAPAGVTWKNGATGDLVAAAGLRGQLAGVPVPGSPTAAVEWSFAS